MNCDCHDWKKISLDHPNLFTNTNSYGWIITWIELSDEGAHHQVNKYGIKISHCPFCGKQLD